MNYLNDKKTCPSRDGVHTCALPERVINWIFTFNNNYCKIHILDDVAKFYEILCNNWFGSVPLKAIYNSQHTN